jgi:hypothetical protein
VHTQEAIITSRLLIYSAVQTTAAAASLEQKANERVILMPREEGGEIKQQPKRESVSRRMTQSERRKIIIEC